ncbi:MAG: VRR-NUC domain-containing protein [Bacteroidota bacterium]
MTDWNTPRSAPPPLESKEQESFFNKARLYLPGLYPHLYAIPNGQLRNKRVAAQLKREGVKAGVEDIAADIARGPFHGLRIEMKRQNATPAKWRKEQREWHERHMEQGFLSVLAKGQTEAFIQAQRFWELGPFDPNKSVEWSFFRLDMGAFDG